MKNFRKILGIFLALSMLEFNYALADDAGNNGGSNSQSVTNTNTTTDTNGDQNANISINDQAFSGVLSKQLPLTPQQIEILHKAYDDVQKAATQTPNIPAKPTTSNLLVDLSPSATPPVIRLGAGYISSLVFLDSAGNPWPISAYSIGDPSSFNIVWDKTSNTLLVQATAFYKNSNLAVILKDLNTPVMLTLTPGQRAIDYRVDLRVPGLAPDAIVNVGTMPGSESPDLLQVLNGLPPAKAKTLSVTGASSQTRAWLYNQTMFLRTDLVLVSPAWKSVMTSVDGMHAYELNPTSLLLIFDKNANKILKVNVRGIN